MSKKVAIIQNKIIRGGRLAVLVKIIKILNEIDIIPDIYSFKMTFTPAEIEKHYGDKTEFNFIPVKGISKIPNRWSILYFNRKISKMEMNYDLVLNNSNGGQFLPNEMPLLHFIHYPQKDRILSGKKSIHFPEEKDMPLLSFQGIYDAFVRPFYQSEKMDRSDEIIVANSQFTKDAILRRFDVNHDKIHIVYPPISVPLQKPDIAHKNFRSVVSTGRFSEMKRQLEQIKIAASLPQYFFHIIGFKEKNSVYFNKCQNLIETKKITNVKLYPNAPLEQKMQLLNTSGLFIHSTRNEPFGITSAEAIASGGIPIVHNSGGQKEIVTFDLLRYETNENCIGIFNNLLGKETNFYQNIFDDLFKNIKQFDESKFEINMKQILKFLESDAK